MRCLALAQAWRDAGGEAVFAMAEVTEALRERLAAESCNVEDVCCAASSLEDARQSIAIAEKHNCSWIVVDGYAFSAEYQRVLKESEQRVLFLDDYGHAEHYYADCVLNQNVCASAEIYVNREPHTRLLLGTKYCLLRREFSAWREWKREIAAVCRHVLVMMGGSDPDSITTRAMEALASTGLEDLAATVVVGGSNPRFDALCALAVESQRITVKRDVPNMSELMAAADVCISAAGTTCWEICLLGLPALLIDVTLNETGKAEGLDRQGCAIHIGDRTVTAQAIAAELKRIVGSQQLRQSLSQRSRELVDGNGAQRVVGVLRESEGAGEARP